MLELSITETAFAGLAAEYHSRKELAEQQVVEWKWESWHMFNPKPLYFERSGHAPGRPLKLKPTDKNNRIEYGLDEERRIVVTRQYNQFGFYETFYKYAPRWIESAHFDCHAAKEPINIELVELEEGKAVSATSSAVNGCSTETYERTGTQVTTIHQATAERIADKTPELLPNYVAACEYDDAGKLQRVTRTWFDRSPAMLVISTDTPVERVGKGIRRRTG